MNQDNQLQNIVETQQKILSIVLDVQAKQLASDKRLEKIEQSFGQLVNRIDELVVLLNRHESEIAAMRDNYYRLAERISFLEQKLALAAQA